MTAQELLDKALATTPCPGQRHKAHWPNGSGHGCEICKGTATVQKPWQAPLLRAVAEYRLVPYLKIGDQTGLGQHEAIRRLNDLAQSDMVVKGPPRKVMGHRAQSTWAIKPERSQLEMDLEVPVGR